MKLRGGSLCGNPQSALNRASVKLLNFLSPARARRYHNVAAAPSSLASFHRGGTRDGGKGHLHKQARQSPSLSLSRVPTSILRFFCWRETNGDREGREQREARNFRDNFYRLRWFMSCARARSRPRSLILSRLRPLKLSDVAMAAAAAASPA